jgi:hypothetical protein
VHLLLLKFAESVQPSAAGTVRRILAALCSPPLWKTGPPGGTNHL